ncbi:MAG: GyrI-like domain-containing protein [Bacillota bacterium]
MVRGNHDPEYRPKDADLEVCLPVAGEAPGGGRVSIKKLPASRAVCLLHVGPYDQVGQTYASILQYIAEKQLTITGPSREVYLVGPEKRFYRCAGGRQRPVPRAVPGGAVK